MNITGKISIRSFVNGLQSDTLIFAHRCKLISMLHQDHTYTRVNLGGFIDNFI